MKNEPTHLEIFQKQRIDALEAEVHRLNTDLNLARHELVVISKLADDRAMKTKVSDPVFLEPFKIIDYAQS